MTQVIPGEDLQPHANKIIMPLYKLSVLDDMHLMKGLPPPFLTRALGGILTGHEDLKPTAQEIMNMLQSKLGTTAYGQAYSAVRAEVLQRRQDRKNKRSIQVNSQSTALAPSPSYWILMVADTQSQMVTDPEEAAKKKIRDNAKKRAAKKEKSAVKKKSRRGKM